jgi:hypothetical protein
MPEGSMGQRRATRPLTVLVGVVAALVVAVAAGFGVAAAATGTGDVYVVHGIADATADVLVDGDNVAPAAAPKTVVGPLQLSPGEHVVTFRDSTQTLVSARFTVKAGTSVDVVAHRTADASRQPVVTVFVNDTSPVRAGMVRLVVSHVAVAPPADIRVDGDPLFRNVASGESLTLDLPAKTSTIDVVPTLTGGPAILQPVMVELKPGTLTRVFAIGDATAGTTDAVVQVLPVQVTGSQRPTRVQTGDGGQAAESFVEQSWSPGPGAVVLFLAVLALAGATVLNRRSGPSHPVIGSRHAR